MLGAEPISEPDPDEPPLVGQPEHFCGAVGPMFQVTLRAAPTELEAGDALMLTVRVTSKGKWKRPPDRPPLAEIKAFQTRFHIEPSSSPRADRDLPTERSWEFDYRLRPKSDMVRQIPSLAFPYYNPRILIPEKRWPVTWSNSVPLTVKPRTRVNITELQGPTEVHRPPDSVYQVVEGEEVLRSESPPTHPGPFLVVLLLAAPAVLTLGWCVAWRLRYPDAVRRLRQRRSLAATRALQSLAAAEKMTDDRLPFRAAAIMAGYLRQRLDLCLAEPTPGEIAAHLDRVCCPPGLAETVVTFFHACDAARYAPGLPSENGLATAARRLIQTLEADSWLSPAS